MSNIRLILQRLSSEGLSAEAASATLSPPFEAAEAISSNGDGFVLVDRDETRQKQRDALLARGVEEAKWMRIFVDLFVTHADPAHDDLLFFVTVHGDILVKRRVAHALPQLDPEILISWRETLCLNVIVQMHCTLTVSVCRRETSRRTDVEMQQIHPSTAMGADSSPAKSSNSSSPSKSKMVALRRIAKKVYAAPYKSRMDVKDAFMNECAYPLVYYTVNDYESSDLHLHIQEKEYLCVELSVLVPEASSDLAESPQSHGYMSNSSTMPLPPPVADNPTPFPVPEGFKKVVLFQGAVPYTALLDIFMQKGSRPANVVSNSSPSSGWGNLSSKSMTNLANGGRNSVTAATERTEYIMMRGPRGKGVCQVAICENILSDTDETNFATSAPSQQSKKQNGGDAASSSLFSMLGGTMRAGMNVIRSGLAGSLGDDVSAGARIPSAAGSNGVHGAAFKKPDALRCSMTYVNVPWHSIMSDLISAFEAGNL
ncbi:hypothetical protein HDU78_002652 [Chytriomyces hyalinus]|nr:hypothetical protein HDU78_002652 [Chytriomyces hyalinus]KAJ3256902.1 hypothetical protein HDU77_002932 [Chytriomyces hyalinus]